MTKKKPRNRAAQDTTLFHLQAVMKRLTRLEDEVRGLHALSTYLQIQVQAIDARTSR